MKVHLHLKVQTMLEYACFFFLESPPLISPAAETCCVHVQIKVYLMEMR